MKKLQFLITIAFVISIMSFNAFATTSQVGIDSDSQIEKETGILIKDKCEKCRKDPIKRLEERKDSIQNDLKEGKITKEQADELTKKLDEHIAKIKEFNSLPLPEKKERLSKKFNTHLENQIKEGKITKEESEQLSADFNKSLESWDGKEPPRFIHKLKKHKD